MYVSLFTKDGKGLADLETGLDRKNFARMPAGRGKEYHSAPGMRVHFTSESVTVRYENALPVEEARKKEFTVPEYVRPTLVMALDYITPTGVMTHTGIVNIDDLREALGLKRNDEHQVQDARQQAL